MREVPSVQFLTDSDLPRLAHPGKRYQAQAIDFAVCLLLFGLSIVLSNTFAVEDQYARYFIFGTPVLYFVLADALPNGQSIGKRILGLYVVSKTTGKSCSVLQSIGRNAATPLLGVFDWLALLGNGRQRLGDMLANTIVIEGRYAQSP